MHTLTVSWCGWQLVDDNAAECAHVHLQVRCHAAPLDMRAAPQSRLLLRVPLPCAVVCLLCCALAACGQKGREERVAARRATLTTVLGLAPQLPQVHVMLMPRDREAWTRTLQVGAWPLVPRRAAATAEDSQRAQAYQVEAERKHAVLDAAASASSLSDLLRSLQVEIKVETHVTGHEERLAQLSSRTNQFNGIPVSPRAPGNVRSVGLGASSEQRTNEPAICACLPAVRTRVTTINRSLLPLP